MKRIFRIGGGLFIYSIIPILSWIVLSYVLNDNRISSVFSLTYAIQFIWSILKHFFGSGANIRKEKENIDSAVQNSMLWGIIFSTIIFSIPLIFVDKYIAFFGQDVEFYRIFVIYSIILLYLQTLFSLIIEQLHFEDKEHTANIHLISFNLINFLVLIFSCMLIKKTIIALIITLSILAVYIIALYIWKFKKFKLSLDFIHNFKYESANILSSIFMMIIYLFGFKHAFSAGPEYLVAINIVGLCTDTQWDMMAAIATVAKIDISKRRFEFKKQIKNSCIYTIVIVSSSIIMCLLLTHLKNAVWNIVLVYLTIQVVHMLIDPYKVILSVFTQLEHSATLNTIFNFSLKVLRTVLSVVIISPYCTDIAQIIAGGLGFIIYVILRVSCYKVIGQNLVLKKQSLSDFSEDIQK